MFSTILRVTGVLALGAALLLPSLSPTTADAAQCRARSAPCTVTVTTNLHTELPTLLCYEGDVVVHINVVINCIGSVSGPTGGSTEAHRCGSDDEPVVFDDGTNVHTIAPAAGGTWGDILNGHCGLDYTIS